MTKKIYIVTHKLSWEYEDIVRAFLSLKKARDFAKKHPHNYPYVIYVLEINTFSKAKKMERWRNGKKEREFEIWC